MSRNIKAQLNHAICENTHIGESKRAYKNQHNGKTDGRTFSIEYTKDLHDCVNSFSKYMKDAHPEVKMAKDITSEMVQGWLNKNKDNWTNATMNSRISQMQKITEQINNTYKSANVQLDLRNPKDQTFNDKIRDKAMERCDYEALRKSFQNSSSQAKHAIEIAGRNGLRVKEISRLKTENINLEKNELRIEDGAKNGKKRDVPIREQDRDYYADLKAELDGKGQEYVCNGILEDSINKAIRTEMKKLGISDKYEKTTNHSIRKMYARERMEEELAKGYSKEKAWSIVQKELGHGAGFRQSLYNTYIGK